MESYRYHKSQIRNINIGEVRKPIVDKENEIREESFKKRHFKKSRDGYGQPPEYNEEYASVNTSNFASNRLDTSINFS